MKHDLYQNEWFWPLFRGRIKVTSTIALQIWRWISRKPLVIEIEAWFRRTTNRKWHMIWAIKWSRDRWRHVTPKVLWDSIRSAILATAWLLVYARCYSGQNYGSVPLEWSIIHDVIMLAWVLQRANSPQTRLTKVTVKLNREFQATW